MKRLFLLLAIVILPVQLLASSEPCIYYASSYQSNDYSHVRGFPQGLCSQGSNVIIIAKSDSEGEGGLQKAIAKICDYGKGIVIFRNKHISELTATCVFNGSRTQGYGAIDKAYDHVTR